MWPGFDPEVSRQLATLRQMVRLTRLTPTREWPLLFVDRYDLLFVVREWPDGTITAYATPGSSDRSRGGGA